MGDEVIRQIKKIDITMVGILITGYHPLQDCIDAIALGIQVILLKPVGADELLRVTQDALSLRQQVETGEVSPKLV